MQEEKDMIQLKNIIKKRTLSDTKNITQTILNMVCSQEDPIPLKEKTLENALTFHGEFLLLQLGYEDFETELKDEKIKYMISQALSVVVTYEDDGTTFNEIEKFVNYVSIFSDAKQNSIFGVKRVTTLSKYPISILFSGILPINQLEMHVGKKIHTLIHSDDHYFKPRFQEFRDTLSKEINTPILPLFPKLDETLQDTEVILRDLYDGRVISRFTTKERVDKDLVELYLEKLFYIYTVLAENTKTAE